MIFKFDLNETELSQNFDEFMALIKKTFTGDRLQGLLELYKEDNYGVKACLAPASGKEHYHMACPGGYILHLHGVYKAAQGVTKLFQILGGTVDYTNEELVFSALHHDLGKLGDIEQGDYYLPQDSEWHLRNKGEVYKFNPKLQYMDVTDRALFILQKFGIKTTNAEWLSIKLSDGMYNEQNVGYLKTSRPEYSLKYNLPRIIHTADYLSGRSETDRWLALNKE